MKFCSELLFINLIQISFALPVSISDASTALRNNGLFDGDIVLGAKHLDPNEEEFFNALPNDNRLWTHAIIPYEIDIKLNSYKNQIESAFKHIHEKTCVRFKERRHESNYIYIHKGDGDHCQSMVGMKGGQQEVVLGSSCLFMGTILHELMHVIGFYHEHSRSDRDEYLEIHLENVVKGKEQNFNKLDIIENRILEPFDYQSVMIYGETSFSANGSPTMLAKNHERLTDPYFKHSLTYYNRLAINKLYHCHIS